jgi:putative ABC transport system permease protein
VAASFAALAEGRRREFGVLAHLGLTRREIAAAVAGEGAAVAALGVAVGLLLAFVIGAVLVFIVNPQSFHWTMDYRVPWASLAAFAAFMVAGAAGAAALAARRAYGAEAVRAVREDW